MDSNEPTSEDLARFLADTKPIVRILSDLAKEFPERPAVTCGDRTVTRAELEARAIHLARAFESLGVSQGDVVTIALPNSIEFYEVLVAIWKLGAIPNPLSYRLPLHERRAIVELANPKLIVGVDQRDHPERCCIPAGFEPDPKITPTPFEDDRVSPAANVIASGGSTGRPKLMVAGSPAALNPAFASAFGMQSNAAVLIASPLYHGAGFTWSMLGLCLGDHLIVLPKFDPIDALDAIQRYRVHWVFLVPTMMSRMLRAIDDNPGRFELSSLAMVLHSAASCPPWVKDAWINLVGPDKLVEVYGASEAPVGTIITGREWLEHRGSVGKPTGGEVKIVGPDGGELPRGEVGEIFMRPPAGQGPKATYIGAEVHERDGWTSVGDLGWMDEDGYLYISDRRVDMIVSGGANVYPAEVEAALAEHPNVTTAIVVGLPDDDLGQRVHALVETTGDVTVDELLSFLAERLVRYKIPRSIRIVHESLRDDADKARRSAVRDQEAALMAANVSDQSARK